MVNWSAIRFLSEQDEVLKTVNRLPHWQQEGSCYFITFRLVDSLPAHVLNRHREDRDTWLQIHPEPWDAATEAEYHRRFSAKIDLWLDAGHGNCRLKTPEAASIVAGAFGYFDTERYLLHAFVVMPNHVHLLLSLAPGIDLKDLVNSWKRHTARKINTIDGRSGALWQRDYFDRLIRGPEHFRRALRYVAKNASGCHSARLYLAEWVKEMAR